MRPLVTSYTLLPSGFDYQVGVAMGGLWLALNQGQPKVSVSLSLDFGERVLDRDARTISGLCAIRILTFACNA